MRRSIMIIMAVLAAGMLFCASVATAGSLTPKADGNGNVIVPDLLIQQIPNFSADKPVYAATHINGWLVREGKWSSDKRLQATKMKQNEDGDWVAEDMAGTRFIPAQMGSDGPNFAKIENLYPLDSDFIAYDNEEDRQNKEDPSLLVE